MSVYGLNLGHDAGLSSVVGNKIYNFEFERHIGIKNVCGGNLNLYNIYKKIISKNEVGYLGICDYFSSRCDWIPQELKDVILLKENPVQEIKLSNIEKKLLRVSESTKIYGIKHHLAHAASTFFTSNFSKALIITADGSSKNAESFSVSIGKNNSIEVMEIFNNIDGPRFGAFYEKFSKKIFSDKFSAGKLMGLSAYGREIPELKDVLRLMIIPNTFREKVFKEKLHVSDNIKLIINNRIYNFLSQEGHHFKLKDLEINEAETSLFEDVFDEIIINEKSFKFDYDYTSENTKNLSFTIQKVFQEELQFIINFFQKKYQLDNICFAGGSFLNISANSKIYSQFKNIHIPPFCNDSGISIGCSLILKHFLLKEKRENYMNIAYGGEYISCVGNFKNLSIKKSKKEDFFKIAISKLIAGKVIGWINSRYELGPRALGNRSILASPLKIGMKDYINNSIKFRESFRPLAPIVIKEKLNKYFYDGPLESPYMLYNYKVYSNYRKELNEILHKDDSTRVQTITFEDNQPIYELLKKFELVTGYPILFNTSLNVKGKPILNTLLEINNILMNTKLDSVFWVDKYWIIETKKGEGNE